MKREWLIAYREAKGLSQQEVADAIGKSQSVYAAYELGIRTPRPLFAKAIARIFKFDWTRFYEKNDK